jgi:phytanoyl-CoA hydroxylase
MEVAMAEFDYDVLKPIFDRDGFIHIHGFFTPEEVEELEANLQRFIRDVVPTLPKSRAMMEDYNNPETLKQIDCLGEDPYFAQLIQCPKITQLAEVLLQDALKPQQVEAFIKPPYIGKPTPPHQDGYYFCLTPNEAVTVWVSLDDIDENGALHYVKGSHRKGILPHGASHVLGFSQGIFDRFWEGTGEAVACPVKRGDCLVHHSLTIHFAPGNTTPRPRRAIGLVYFAQRARVDEEARRRYQESLARQREALGVS